MRYKDTVANSFSYENDSFSPQLWDIKEVRKRLRILAKLRFSPQLWDIKDIEIRGDELESCVLAPNYGI